MKKLLSFLPVIAIVACTDYQANWENSFSAQDAQWQAIENAAISSNSVPTNLAPSSSSTSNTSINPESSESTSTICEEGNIVTTEEAGCTVGLICSDNVWVEYSRKCDSKPTSSATTVIASSSSKTLASSSSKTLASSSSVTLASSSSNTAIAKSSSSSATATLILDYNFNKTPSLTGWTIYVYKDALENASGNVQLTKNNDSLYVLQFYPNGEMEENWWLQATYPVTLKYGKSYQIKLSAYPYGTNDSFYIGIQDTQYNSYVDGNVNLDTDLDSYDQWYSDLGTFCKTFAVETNLVINGGKGNSNGFAIQWVQIEERASSCL